MPERPCCICGRPVKTLGGVVYAGGDHLPGAGGMMEPNGLMLEIDGQDLPCHFHCIAQVTAQYGEPDLPEEWDLAAEGDDGSGRDD